MALSTDNTNEPVHTTLVRFMDAVRQEKTEQVVETLRTFPNDVARMVVMRITILLIPSSEMSIRAVIQSEYLNNNSATNEEISQAARVVLRTESVKLIHERVIESSPLMLAIKQGSVGEVQSLLQTL